MPTELEQMEADLLFWYIPEHGRLALDIGANEGFWSRELAEHFDLVHAYEPQLGLTSAPENVQVFNSAVGRTSGRAMLKRYADSGHATIVEREDAGYGPLVAAEEVDLIALDDYYGGDVDFLKIDVEGAEVGVIRGAQVMLAQAHPPLVVEIHSVQARAQVLELLSSYRNTVIANPLAPNDQRYCWIYAHA
jgi:FkbM family methyltransferase